MIERRRRERGKRIDRAERYAAALVERVPSLRAVIVFGSVARGDWNKWSDIDVLVVADDLPDDALARLDVVLLADFAGVQPVAWTPAELAARRPTDPIVAEVNTVGVVVHGELTGGGGDEQG